MKAAEGYIIFAVYQVLIVVSYDTRKCSKGTFLFSSTEVACDVDIEANELMHS